MKVFSQEEEPHFFKQNQLEVDEDLADYERLSNMFGVMNINGQMGSYKSIKNGNDLPNQSLISNSITNNDTYYMNMNQQSSSEKQGNLVNSDGAYVNLNSDLSLTNTGSGHCQMYDKDHFCNYENSGQETEGLW